MRPPSEVVLPDPELDLNYALRDFPNGIPSIVHLLCAGLWEGGGAGVY